MITELVQETCTPCRGGIPPLTAAEAARYHEEAPDWSLLNDSRQIERTFWFANYQGTRIRKGLTRLFTVPTPAMRGGDFTGLPTIYDPDTTSGAARQPFPGVLQVAPRDEG